MNALKKYWPEALVLIGIVLEFAIKQLTAIEQANEKTTVVSLLLALLVALYARHFKGGATTDPPPVSYNRQGRTS